jgi:DNA processing protein
MSADVDYWTANAHRAYIALAHLANPADTVIGNWVKSYGPEATVQDLLCGRVTKRDPGPIAARWRVLCERQDAGVKQWQILTRDMEQWPDSLSALDAQQPFALWIDGQPSVLGNFRRTVAIVGARASTHYGSMVARSWAADLSESGFTVLSGGAFGIDAAAHSGALAAGGVSVAVSAGGVDTPYPAAHRGLFAAISSSGCVVTEAPPGERVRRERFLTRNRLIAALSVGTVVVEAAPRSGSLTTADHAARLHRIVMAVPGPVTSQASLGVHNLIVARKAELVTSAADVISMVLPLGESPDTESDLPSGVPQLSRCAREVADAFPRHGVTDLASLIRVSGYSRDHVIKALVELQAAQQVEGSETGWALIEA